MNEHHRWTKLISCYTEVKTRHAAHVSAETKVNSTQFNQELYGVIYDVLRLDTWQETRSVCVCMPLSLCLWRADGGSGHTCPNPQINPPKPPPPLWSINGHIWPLTSLESILIGGKCSQWPSRNNAQWSVRGRGGRVCRHVWRGGGRHSLPLVPPSIQTQKWSCVTTSQEQTGSLFFHLGDEKELGMAVKRSSPWKEKNTFSESGSDCFLEKEERRRFW